MAEQTVDVLLEDKHPDYEGKLPARVRADYAGIEIGLEGFQGGGYVPSEWRHPDFGVPVFLELYEGKVQLVVWADATSDEPTHVIDLSQAFAAPSGRKAWDPSMPQWRRRK